MEYRPLSLWLQAGGLLALSRTFAVASRVRSLDPVTFPSHEMIWSSCLVAGYIDHEMPQYAEFVSLSGASGIVD